MRGEFFRVERRDRLVKSRRLGVVTLFGQLHDIRTHDRDIGTLHRAVTERVFGIVEDGKLVAPPQPTVDLKALLGPFRRRLLRCLPDMLPGTRQSFCDTYRGSRRARYSAAALTLPGRPLVKKDAEQTCFVKSDKDNHTTKDDPAPRAIMFRTARYNVEVGRHLKFLEHRLVGAIAALHRYPVVCKGYSPQGVAKILSDHLSFEANVVAVSLDASRWDQSMSEPLLKWEHSVYNAVFKSEDLAKWLRWQLRSVARGRCADGNVMFSRIGGRGSGDMNTGMGNCLCMVGLVSTFTREVCGDRFRLANNGDDCVLFVPREFFPEISAKVKDWFLRAGIRMKVDGVTNVLEEIEFCQQHPVCVNGSYTMVRNPAKAVSCDPVSTKCLDVLQAKQHLMAVGVCGGVISRGVPMLQAWYAALRARGTGNARRLLLSDEYGHFGFTAMAYLTSSTLEVHTSVITDVTRVSFWKAFGITPDEQCAAEAYFASGPGCWPKRASYSRDRYSKHAFAAACTFLPTYVSYALQR